jgi:hypothetical protein
MSKNKERGFIYKLFNDLFVVTINHEGSSREIRLREIKKITNNYLKGIDDLGHKVEFRTSVPFDYFVKKIY